MENWTVNNILENLSDEKLGEIISAVKVWLAKSRETLVASAAGSGDEDTYIQIVEYCTSKVDDYASDPGNMKKILTDPTNIEGAYAALTDTEEFKAIGSKEHRALPRVVAMMILAGSETQAADTALKVMNHLPEEDTKFLDHLADKYHGYMKDASEYGNGDNKNLYFTGKKD